MSEANPVKRAVKASLVIRTRSRMLREGVR
jgi:hypothetical protein